jgi:hypothetical protein
VTLEIPHGVATPPPAAAWSEAASESTAVAAMADGHRARRTGRAFAFPGVDVEAATVGELLEQSAIERVVVLGGADADGATPIHTQGFLRPEYVEGQLVLRARPAANGLLAPFEQPNPTPCCAEH